MFKPGQHGSTFGGNPLACAVAREVIAMLATGEFQERSAKLGAHMHGPAGGAARRAGSARCAGGACGRAWSSPSLTGREVCERLAERGVLAKDTHGTTIRLAPPLMIAEEDLDWALDQVEAIVR